MGGGGSDHQSQSQLSSAFPRSTHQLPRRSSPVAVPDGPSPSVFGCLGDRQAFPSVTSPEWCSWGPMGKPSDDGTVQLSHPQTLTTGRIATSLACWLGSANPRCHRDQPADHEDGTAIPLSRLDRPSRVQAADASSIREGVSRNLEKNYQHRQPFILSFTPPVTLYHGRQGSFRRCRHGGDRRRCPPRRGAPELRQPVVSSRPSLLITETETAKLTSPQATMRRTGVHRPDLLRFGQRLHLWQRLVLAVSSRQRRPVVVVVVGPAAPHHLADQQLVDSPRHLVGRDQQQQQQQQQAHHHGHADGVDHGHAQRGARRCLDDGQLHGQPL